MQIAYNTKYPQLLCVVLFLFVVRNAAQLCICDDNRQTRAQFRSNLVTVFKNLVNYTSKSNNFNTSVYGQSPDTVYGLLRCFGGATVEECFNCSIEITDQIRNDCGSACGGRCYLDRCSLRYQNYSFIGMDYTKPTINHYAGIVIHRPDVFRTAVKEMFTNLTQEALESPIRYSSRYMLTSTYYPIYSLVQCWSDLTSVEDCTTCLTKAINVLLEGTFVGNQTSMGGMSDGRICFARYEAYPFFSPATPLPPSPLQRFSPPPIQHPSLSPRTANKSPNKIVIILGIVNGFLIMLLLCVFATRIKFKSAVSWMPAIIRKEENLDTDLDFDEAKPGMNFNLENIKAATNNFHEDNKLGEGGFGSVYKGTMPNGIQIAVKRLSENSSQGKKQFLNEVKLVAKIQHRNLVNLLGYCAEGVERLLVYEFLSNKSLDKILFDPQRSEELDWPKRLNIILGVARGLLYLHHDSQLQIIHRDIKTSNILLDEKMLPKISDFGLARLFNSEETHVNTMVAGTLGYMAPECAINRQLSVKADVFSFGVVILEIICGKKNNDSRLPLEFQSLLDWVWRYYTRGNIIEIIDKTILNCSPNEQVRRCIHVGLLCTQADPLLRPPMVKVYAMLSNASVTNLPDPTKPAYLSITQDNVPRHTSASTFASTTSSASSTTHLACPSINDTSITDLGAR